MEFTSKIRWAIFITVGVLVLILICWGLFSIAQSIFNPRDNNSTESTQNIDRDIASDARTFSFTTIGPIIADNEHRESIITVSPNVVEMKTFRGYNNEVIESRSYQNTQESYNEFRSALEILGISQRLRGTDKEDDNNDEGYCATGRRYIVDISSEIRRWSTSCSSKQGTAAFAMNRVRQLFQKQVPEFNEINRDTGL